VLIAVPLGLVIGAVLGMIGGGGSVLILPILVYLLGQSVHDATTTSLVVVGAGAVASSMSHARAQGVCWRHAAAFTIGALPGVLSGTALSQEVAGATLLSAFALIMLLAAAATWRKASTPRNQLGVPETPQCPRLILGRDLAAGLLVGAITGLFGVGGGFLIVPTLVIFLSLSMRLAVGTSLAIISASSIMALVTHLAGGRALDVPITLTLTVTCIAGAITGGRLAGRIPQRILGRGFAVALAGVSVYLLVSIILLGGPPRA
jgi:uncharacterized protein